MRTSLPMPDINEKPKSNDEIAKIQFKKSLAGVITIGIIVVVALIVEIIF